MSKTAFVFPGQGAQYIGMGQSFYEQFEVCRAVFECASKASGLDVPKLCFAENDKINITEYTQIAMITVELAILKLLQEKGIKPDVAAGLSLGEYGALATAGVMDFADIFRVVRKRGIFMQEAMPEGGSMVAVMGAETALVEKVCAETEGIVSVANYNCPGQLVISGKTEAVSLAVESLKNLGIKKCLPLNVSGPFHTELLTSAAAKLEKELEKVAISDIAVPYLTNVTADYMTEKDQIKETLKRQICSPVKWQQSIERMIADGVNIFIEIGPGKTLKKLIGKINKEVTIINISEAEDLAQLEIL